MHMINGSVNSYFMKRSVHIKIGVGILMIPGSFIYTFINLDLVVSFPHNTGRTIGNWIFISNNCFIEKKSSR